MTTPVPDAVEESAGGRRSLFALSLAVAAVAIVIDQVTKWWAVRVLMPRTEPIEVIGTFLQLTYVENTGAAFGIGTGFTWIFTGIAIVVAVVILRTARKLGSVWWAIALGALLGGALGNLIDRLTRPPGIGRGYVVDFIELPNWPVFNVADMCVVGSAILMVALTLFGIDYTGARARGTR